MQPYKEFPQKGPSMAGYRNEALIFRIQASFLQPTARFPLNSMHRRELLQWTGEMKLGSQTFEPPEELVSPQCGKENYSGRLQEQSWDLQDLKPFGIPVPAWGGCRNGFLSATCWRSSLVFCRQTFHPQMAACGMGEQRIRTPHTAEVPFWQRAISLWKRCLSGGNLSSLTDSSSLQFSIPGSPWVSGEDHCF